MKIIPLKLRRWGFTLVELLVLIGLVGLMGVIGVMLPACSKSKGLSDRARSISNQGQIGKAYAGYVNDHNDYYPEVFGLAGVGGQPGNFLDVVKSGGRLPVQVTARIYGATTPAEKRPLNEYVNNNFEIFHDPADIGGTALNVDSCYEAFGNSYQPAVADDMFRVKRVLGERTEDAGTPYRGPGWQKGRFNHSDKSEADDPYEGQSMRQSEMVNPSNKIIQGDWNWPYDQNEPAQPSKSGGGHVMLYGDGHAEYYVFPPSKLLMQWFTPQHLIVKDTNGVSKRNGREEYIYDNAKFRAETGQDFDYIDPKYKWW